MSRVLHLLMRKKRTVVSTPLDITVDTSIADVAALGVYVMTFPTIIGTVTVDWGDGSTSTPTALTPLSHTYATPGVYNIKISGSRFAVRLGNALPTVTTGKRLIAVNDWGTIKYTSMISMFEQNTRPFTVPAATAPDLSICTNMGSMFKGATTFNQPIGHWNVSNVSLMQGVFDQAAAFNQPLSGWDVSKVTTLNIMFRGATSFNQNLSSWNIGACLNTNGMFTNAAAFNNGGDPGINNWNTSKVTNMGSMFNNASTFNQPVGNWDMRKVTTTAGMFYRAYAFNQPIGTWNIPLVTDTSQMFAGGGVGTMTFNQPLVSTATTWQVGQITNIVVMFQNSNSFDQDLSSWVCTQITAANESTTATAFSTGANAAWRAARATKFPFLNDGVTRIST